MDAPKERFGTAARPAASRTNGPATSRRAPMSQRGGWTGAVANADDERPFLDYMTSVTGKALGAARLWDRYAASQARSYDRLASKVCTDHRRGPCHCMSTNVASSLKRSS